MIGWLAGAAALGAATAFGAHAFIPRSQLYGRTFIGTPGIGKQLALTFDDGPNPACTPQLLDVLAKHNVCATFFLVGKWIASHPDLARKINAGGHEIGNHTQTHPNLLLCSAGELRKQLNDCRTSIENAGLAPSNLFRPPWGARRPATLRVARELGYTPVMWSVTCYDWKPTTADRIEAHAVRQVRGGDILLLHDGDYSRDNADRTATVGAVERIISRYKSDGYTFVTVGEMIRLSDASGGSLSRSGTP
jgi:peptidoglycan/xylan/chitin deacetylase (PgdA/CDA1 family)